jgi:predicted NodU family carbamoyl transferase
MEWGPRALGNRSILADPRNPEMKNILNIKIKKRESFRPFAPSILIEDAKDWFEDFIDEEPFMSRVLKFKTDKIKEILDTVDKELYAISNAIISFDSPTLFIEFIEKKIY